MAFCLEDILKILEELAPSRLSESWDNPGLQVGRRDTPVERILVSLDLTREAVQEAARRAAQLLLTHHPLIFKPVSSIEPTRYPGDVLCEAIQNDIAIASIHTNLDAARGGLNDVLSEMLGLREVHVLEEGKASREPGEGLGRLGLLSQPVSLSELARSVKQAFQVPAIGVVGASDLRVRCAAVVGGSGCSLIPDASRKGADVLITGDVGHHDALRALQWDVALIDAGHFHTEKAAMSTFCHVLTSRLEQAAGKRIEVAVFQGETAPMRFE